MPFLQTDEELEKQTNAGQISGPSAGPMSSAAPKKAGSPASSGSWVNLQKYVDANKQQANQMGDAVVGTADTAGQQAQTATQNFQAKVPEKTKQYSAQDLETQYYANPNADKAGYQNIKTTGGYTGPQNLEEAGYGAAESAVGKANEKLNNLQTEQGRQQILGEVYGKPSYTGGQKTFDNLLLQNTSGVQNKVADANNRWGGLTGMLSGAKQQASEVIPQNIATAAQNAQTATQAEQDYVNKFLTPIKQRATDQTAANSEYINRIKNDIGTVETSKLSNSDAYFNNNSISPETAALLGLPYGGQMRTYGVDINSYLNPNQTQLGANDVATEAERGQWGQLMNLIGGNDPALSATGTTNAPALSFNKKGFMDAVAAAEQSGAWKQGLAENTWSSPEALAAWKNAEGWLNYGGGGQLNEDPLAFLLPENSFGSVTGGLKG
jgi:hypothetical protein